MNFRVPRRREKKGGQKKILEAITVENFPNMGKEIVNQVKEAQKIPYRINPRRNIPRHILIKLSKIKYKQKNIKQSKGKKQQITHKGIPIRLTADLSAENRKAEERGRTYFKR